MLEGSSLGAYRSLYFVKERTTWYTVSREAWNNSSSASYKKTQLYEMKKIKFYTCLCGLFTVNNYKITSYRKRLYILFTFSFYTTLLSLKPYK